MEFTIQDSVHDSFVSVTGNVPTDEQIQSILRQLPKEIIAIAEEWGPYDTLFADKVYVWIQNHLSLIG